MWQIDGIGGRTVTYKELADRIPRLACGLRHQLGLNDGDVITFLLPNCIEFVELYIAAATIGVTISAINPLYTACKNAVDLCNTHNIQNVISVHIYSCAHGATI